jgi:membrane-bound lytic murein transglycosylase B
MRKFTKWTIVLISIFIFLSTSSAFAYNNARWRAWLNDLRTDAIAEGIDLYLFDQIFHDMTPSPKHLHFDRTQPEHRLTYYEYRNTRANQNRIRTGRKMYQRHKFLLNEIGSRYGVNPCIIVSLWGLETAYGNYMGDFNVIRSLATLAYDSRRSAFFRKELLLALHMVNDGHVDLKNFIGEWAGASGQSQFLPSSWYKYAVDYDGDGRKDIWQTYPDIFASIANYLYQNGWEHGQPVLVEVILPDNFDDQLMGYEHKKTVAEWERMGVKIKDGQLQPRIDALASIIHPYGGPTWMVFNNFLVLLTWNYSRYYAGTVNYLAMNVCQVN